MRLIPVFFLPVIIAILSCGNPAGKSNETIPAETVTTAGQACPEYFYYYNQEKIPLQVHPQMIIAGFQPEAKADAQRKILSRFKEFESFSTEQSSGGSAFAVVKLKTGTTCKQVLAMAEKLKQQPEVLYANPGFRSPRTLGSAYPWVGVTSEFLVTLKNTSDKATFEKTVAETRTKVVDTLGDATFLLQATKTSKGNALEMANYFGEQPYAQHSEPDFYLASPNLPATGAPKK